MLKVRIAATAHELVELRPAWEELVQNPDCTVFQDFDLNLLAAKSFANREVPHVICAMSANGFTMIPAAIRLRDVTIRLLGEELFDYRMFLHVGDEETLRAAFAELARLCMPMDVVALRQPNLPGVAALSVTPFAGAPLVSCSQTNAEEFCRAHNRLPRNLRRLAALGFEVKRYEGDNPQLLRAIYHLKAAQDPQSLFHDPERVEFVVNAALLRPDLFEIFTLQRGSELGAALVTLRDRDVRRLYTGWFAPELARHSPSLSLIHHVTCETLAAGQDCDYMTGEQPYKLRLATGIHQLYRAQATVRQLSRLLTYAGETAQPIGR